MKAKSETQEWHPVQYGDGWVIQDSPMYSGKNVLYADEVGEEQAEANANLCACAPILRDALKKLTLMAETSGGTSGSDAGLMKSIDEAKAILHLTAHQFDKTK